MSVLVDVVILISFKKTDTSKKTYVEDSLCDLINARNDCMRCYEKRKHLLHFVGVFNESN